MTKLIKKLDAGPILSQSSLSIDCNMDRELLLEKLNMKFIRHNTYAKERNI